jgi:hypothetical protein
MRFPLCDYGVSVMIWIYVHGSFSLAPLSVPSVYLGRDNSREKDDLLN